MLFLIYIAILQWLDTSVELKSELSVPSVLIQHEWIEVVEHDVEAGLFIMFTITLLAVFGALFTLCSRETSSPDTSQNSNNFKKQESSDDPVSGQSNSTMKAEQYGQYGQGSRNRRNQYSQSSKQKWILMVIWNLCCWMIITRNVEKKGKRKRPTPVHVQQTAAAQCTGNW